MSAQLSPLTRRPPLPPTGKWKSWKPRAPGKTTRTIVDRLDPSVQRTLTTVNFGEGSLPVLVVEDDVARVFACGRRGAAELPEASTLGRVAVSLGRYLQVGAPALVGARAALPSRLPACRPLQDPLAEVAYAWARRLDVSKPGVAAAAAAGVASVGEDVLELVAPFAGGEERGGRRRRKEARASWSVQGLAPFMAPIRPLPLSPPFSPPFAGLALEAPPHLLHQAAERAMVEAACAAGVDVNFVLRRPHLSCVMQVRGEGAPVPAAPLLCNSLLLPVPLPSPCSSSRASARARRGQSCSR